MAGIVLFARLRSSRGRRVMIALFAVPAILVGLLAMHVLTTTGMSNSPTSSGAMAAHHLTTGTLTDESVATSPGMPVPTEDCGGLCGPSHDMLGMICVLALLAAVILLSLHLVLIRWEQLRRFVHALPAKAAALAPPAPPSLHILSISRT